MNLKKIKNYLATLAAGAVIFSSVCALNNTKPKAIAENITLADSNDPNIFDDWIESKGWKITSYGHANEALYSGGKIQVFDKSKKLLGLYRKDFLPWVKINGSGVGDGIGNDKAQFLCYDYNINDGVTHYLIDHPQGAYGNIIYSWLEDNPSVAVNPPLPQGTRIKFKDLNLKQKLNHPWVEDLLLSKTFHADDRFFLPEAEKSNKKIDVYVGVILFKNYTADNYQALLLEDVTALIEPPSPDLNKDGFIDFQDFKILAGNWLKEDRTQYMTGDLNYDNKIDFNDFSIFMSKWKNRK